MPRPVDASAVAPVQHERRSSEAISVPMIVGSAVLAGVGIMGMIYWLVTFNWLFFASVIPLSGGAYLFFTRATGPDHA